MSGRKFSEHPKAEFWDYENNDLTPDQVALNSNSKFWFNCNCGHRFNSTLSDINRGGWCPYCGIVSKKLCSDSGCGDCYTRSFASSSKAPYWDYGKNELTPRDFAKKSSKKAAFICMCGHKFEIIIRNIANGSWCPYCSNPPQKLCPDTDCNGCYSRSFASSDKAQYWDYDKNNLTPRDIFKSSGNKFHFICYCGHKFTITPHDVTSHKQWCPYCSVPAKILCPEEGCLACHNKSFITYNKSIYWDYNKNKMSPRNVFKGSNIKFWFICVNKHMFKIAPVNIARGEWCSKCKNKTEQKLFDNFTTYTLSTQTRFDWCRGLESNFILPFDFLIVEHNIIIELDGIQHFKQVSNWDPPEKQQTNDKRKMQLANEHGYSVIRILQEDVAGDKMNWVAELTTHIEKIIALGPGNVRNSFIGGDIYNNHRPTFTYNGELVIDDMEWLD